MVAIHNPTKEAHPKGKSGHARLPSAVQVDYLQNPNV